MNKDKPFNERPIYNIGAVKRMTDIPAATLRVWERRYDFPNPERTSGGHRIYSENDIQQLQWVKARLDEGMQISQAVEALRTLKAEGRSLQTAATTPVSGEVTEGETPSLSVFKDQLRDALLANNTQAADQILGNLIALYPLEDLLMQVIRPTMQDVGDQWLQGKISVADEHAATYYLRHRMIMWMESGPPPYSVPPVLLACAPDEWHEGSLLMLGVMLRRRRWPVTYLGQSLPLEDLAEFVRETHPPAVTIVAMQAKTAEALAEWPKWLPEAAETNHPIFTYGGRIFTEEPEWRQRVPGIFLGDSLCEGLDTLERILRKQTGIGNTGG